MVKLGILCLSLLGIYCVLDYIFTDDTSYMTRITFHDFYEMKEVNTVYVGASHTFMGINAEQLTEELGKEVFTLSTSAQNVIDSYYLVKEASRKYHLKEVYLEISPNVMNEHVGKEAIYTYIISDYLRNPLLKIQYLMDTFDEEELIPAVLRVRRNLNVLNWDSAIWYTPYKKELVTYKNYETDNYQIQYLGHGSWNDEVCKWKDIPFVDEANVELMDVSVSEIDQKQLEYLLKIVDFCKEKDIKLTLYTMPYAEFMLYHNENYTEFVTYFQNMADEYDLGWIDLNLVRSEYLSLTSADFRDSNHLNLSGNKKTTDFLVKYLRDPKPDYFWESLEQKEEQAEPHIVALKYSMACYNAIGEAVDGIEKDGDYLEYEVSVMANGISELSYEIYYCYGEDDNKNVNGEKIMCGYGEDGSIQFAIPYVLRDTAFAIEIFDAITGESLHRVVKDG